MTRFQAVSVSSICTARRRHLHSPALASGAHLYLRAVQVSVRTVQVAPNGGRPAHLFWERGNTFLDDLEGLCTYTETHIFWILVNKGRKPFQRDQPTEAEKAQAFTDSWPDACTYISTGPSRVAIHRLFSTNPQVGDCAFEYEMDGDMIKYWPPRPDGSRGATGMAKRLPTRNLAYRATCWRRPLGLCRTWRRVTL